MNMSELSEQKTHSLSKSSKNYNFFCTTHIWNRKKLHYYWYLLMFLTKYMV